MGTGSMPQTTSATSATTTSTTGSSPAASLASGFSMTMRTTTMGILMQPTGGPMETTTALMSPMGSATRPPASGSPELLMTGSTIPSTSTSRSTSSGTRSSPTMMLQRSTTTTGLSPWW